VILFGTVIQGYRSEINILRALRKITAHQKTDGGVNLRKTVAISALDRNTRLDFGVRDAAREASCFIERYRAPK
jgi:hypothetical protein